MQKRLQEFSPFRVELGEIRGVPGYHVIYLSVRAGLRGIAGIARRAVWWMPVVQGAVPLPSARDSGAGTRLGNNSNLRRDWPSAAGTSSASPSFVVDKLTFVQNTLDNRWTDLNSWQLSTSVPSL